MLTKSTIETQVRVDIQSQHLRALRFLVDSQEIECLWRERTVVESTQSDPGVTDHSLAFCLLRGPATCPS